MVGCFDRIEKQKKKRKKTKRGISFVFSFRRVNSTPPPTILTYRSPEGEEEGMVIRAEIYAIALQHSAKTSGGEGRE